MISIRRQYRLVQFLILTFGLGTAGLLLWAALRPGMIGLIIGRTASDCGCGVIAYSPTFGAVWTSRLLLSAAVILWIRIAWFFGRGIQRSRKHHAELLSGGYRLVQHQRGKYPYYLLPRTEHVAMTTGLWRARIIISEGLIRALSASEVEAVLAHESAHAAARDPLLTVILDAVNRAFWNLPWLQSWITSSYTLRELSADASATADYRHVNGLAGAFLKLAVSEAPSAVSSFSPNHDRLEKLLDARWKPKLTLWRWRYGLGIAVLLAALIGLSRFSQTQAATASLIVPQSCHEVRLYCPRQHMTAPASVMIQSPVFMYVIQSPAQ